MKVQDVLCVTQNQYLQIEDNSSGKVWQGYWLDEWFTEIPKELHKKQVKRLETDIKGYDNTKLIIIVE